MTATKRTGDAASPGSGRHTSSNTPSVAPTLSGWKEENVDRQELLAKLQHSVDEEEVVRGFLVWEDIDQTEGRMGRRIVAHTTSRATAERLAEGRGVQGAPGEVEPTFFAEVGVHIYAPCYLERPTPGDLKADAKRYREEERKMRLKDLRRRLEEAGFSEEDLELLRAED